MKLTAIAAILAICGGAAAAQEAFITQLGSDNNGANVSRGDFAGTTQQVIYQRGNDLSAVNLGVGAGNTAWAWQDWPDGQNFRGQPQNNQATSLIWQDVDTDSAGNPRGGNTAVNVQLLTRTTNVNPRSGVAQTIQRGSGNTAINWMSGGPGEGSFDRTMPTASAPTLAVTPPITQSTSNSFTVGGITVGASN